jgi:HD domain-containing protein
MDGGSGSATMAVMAAPSTQLRSRLPEAGLSGTAADAATDLIAIPLGLLADLPVLPFDVYVRRGRGLVLYAIQGAPVLEVLLRARGGMAFYVRPAHGEDIGRLHVAVVAKAIRQPSRPVAERAAEATTSTIALLSHAVGLSGMLARDFGRVDRDAIVALAAAADLLARGTAEPGFAHAILRRERGPSGSERSAFDRTIDGLVYAVALARAIGFRGGDAGAVGDLAKAMLLRDLGRPPGQRRIEAVFRVPGRGDLALPAITGARDAWRPPDGAARAATGDGSAMSAHPIRSLELVVDALGEVPSYARTILEHHERWDGSGSPLGLRGPGLSDAGTLAALADSFASMLPPGANRGALRPFEAIRLLRFVSGGRFPPDLVTALVELIAAGHLYPASGAAARLS